MQGVPGAVRHDVTDDGMADQGEVADEVENLVAHELVIEAQRVEDAGVADDDRVLERAAERQPLLAQPLDFFRKPNVRAGRCAR